MIERSNERGSGISVLPARHDDDLLTIKQFQVLLTLIIPFNINHLFAHNPTVSSITIQHSSYQIF